MSTSDSQAITSNVYRAITFTIALILSCFAALACSCPWGFVSETLAHSAIVLIFFGLAVSIIVSLAAWGILRDSDSYKRFAVPIVLLTLLHAVSWFGRWNNSNDYTSQSVKEIVPLFLLASLFFYVVRLVCRWRIEPSNVDERRLTLPHMFLWTAVAGFAFAVIGWFRPEPDEFMITSRDAPKLVSILLIGFGACWLGFAGIGLALEGFRRRRYWGVLSIGGLIVVSPMIKFHVENGFPNGFVLAEWLLLLLPTVMVIFPCWCFSVYGSFGFTLTKELRHPTSVSRFAGNTLAVVGCVLLLSFAYAANVGFASQRNAKALTAAWLPHGVMASSSDGRVFDQAFFDSDRPLTREKVTKLKNEKLTSVTIWGHVPELGCLQNLVSSESVERVILRGGTITKVQLEELYDAKHLKQIFVECKAPLTGDDVASLQAALPICDVIKE